MAISFVASATTAPSSVTTASIAIPAGIVQNDLILMAICDWGGAITLPTGYTSLASGNMPQSTANHHYNVGFKVAGASEVAGSATFAVSSWASAVTFGLRGAATVTPVTHTYPKVDATAYTTTVPQATGAIDGATDGTVYIFSGVDSAASGAITLTFPAGLSNAAQVTNSSQGGCTGIAWGTNVLSPGSATASTAIDYADFLLDVVPAAPAVVLEKFRLTNPARYRATNW